MNIEVGDMVTITWPGGQVDLELIKLWNREDLDLLEGVRFQVCSVDKVDGVVQTAELAPHRLMKSSYHCTGAIPPVFIKKLKRRMEEQP